jgi:hypothetical protein
MHVVQSRASGTEPSEGSDGEGTAVDGEAVELGRGFLGWFRGVQLLQILILTKLLVFPTSNPGKRNILEKS